MKQASFKICQDVKPKIESNNIESNSIETNNIETNNLEKKNITSTKPIKLVENIYYFK
jgi:hypothetical protein